MALFETIKYKVLSKDKNIEIREYEDILLASTKTILNENQDSGFNNVFDYISGKNQEKTKISMTTPVVTYKDDDKLTVSKPSEKEVFINELKKSLYGVIRLMGSWTDNNFDKYNQILVDYLLSNNYEILSARLILRY